MRIDEMTRQHITFSSILQLVNSGIFDDLDSALETCSHHGDLAQETKVLCETTKKVMNHLPVMSTVHLFETEVAMVHYTSRAGLSLYIFPRLVNQKGSEQEIKPAFISDGIAVLDEDLYLYICDSFSPSEQLEILQAIMRWYQANLLSSRNNSNRRICQCVSDLCRELQQLLNSDDCD